LNVLFLGNFNNVQATEFTIKQGWLHTGDIGYFDERIPIVLQTHIICFLRAFAYKHVGWKVVTGLCLLKADCLILGLSAANVCSSTKYLDSDKLLFRFRT